MDCIWAASVLSQPSYFFKHIVERKLEEKGRIARVSSVTQRVAVQFVHNG